MIEISWPYTSLDTKEGFLRIKQWVFKQFPGLFSEVWITAFFIHALGSIFVLFAGFTQFFRRFLWTKVHRSMGAIYIVVVLFISAPTGFIMGLVANAGIISVISFSLLSVLWWYFTFKAYRAIREKNYEKHARFMYRSFALTLSALTLRLWKWLIVNYIYEMRPMDVYRLAGILGWTLNLLVAEILIFKGRHLKMLRPDKKLRKTKNVD
ncbi:MAG: DUF2306 domain-containing protein [Crocinitomicaceae bacterium]|nr:DUF2306 domain-containing protein [Crocinitomicaceae bacterium]